MNVIYLILLLASAVCFGLAAFAPTTGGKRLNLLPLGLLLFVLYFLVAQFQVL